MAATLKASYASSRPRSFYGGAAARLGVPPSRARGRLVPKKAAPQKSLAIESVGVNTLKPDPRNARNHDEKNLAAIKGSLETFGQQKPIVVTADGVVVAGNGTLEAAKALGWQTVDVVRTELTAKLAKAYALADNRTAELAEWDTSALNATLAELTGEGFDVGAIGFDFDGLAEEPTEGLCDPDDVPENVETRCKPGDLWVLGKHRLLCGDARDTAAIDRLTGGIRPDAVFTDPPYGMNAVAKDDGRVGGRGTLAKAGKYKPIIGDDGEFDAAFLLALSDVSFIFGGNFFAHKLPRSCHWLVWNKRANSDREREFDTSDCELVYTNVPKRTNVPSYTHVWAGMFRAGSKKDECVSRVHPTQKPVGLCAEILESYDYQTIIDPFLGSGSTLIACEKTGRRCFGMEIDPHYCDVIISRWERFTGKEAELAST